VFFSIRRQLKKFSQKPDVKLGFQGEDIKLNWEEVIKKINKNAQGKSQALFIEKKGTLVVKVVSHIWLQEMVYYQEEIKSAVNKKDKNIKKVRFTI